MNKQWLVVGTAAAIVAAFVAGTLVFRDRSNQVVAQAAQTHTEALVRAHSPVYAHPARRVSLRRLSGLA